MLCTGFVKVRRHAASPRRSPTSCWIPCTCEHALYHIISWFANSMHSMCKSWEASAASAIPSGRIPRAGMHMHCA